MKTTSYYGSTAPKKNWNRCTYFWWSARDDSSFWSDSKWVILFSDKHFICNKPYLNIYLTIYKKNNYSGWVKRETNFLSDFADKMSNGKDLVQLKRIKVDLLFRKMVKFYLKKKDLGIHLRNRCTMICS